MYSAEVLSQLRSLNWLTQEIARVPVDSPEHSLLRAQTDGLRARLPSAILGYHDQLRERGQASAVQVHDRSCSSCHIPLTDRLLQELSVTGCFGVCPQCGVFLWSGDAEDAPSPFHP